MAVGIPFAAIPAEALDAIADALYQRLALRFSEAADDAAGGEWLTTKDAAAYLGLPSANSLHKLTAERRIPFSQEVDGGACYFRRRDLDAFRERHMRGPELV